MRTRMAQAGAMLVVAGTMWGCGGSGSGGGTPAGGTSAAGDAAAERDATELGRYADAVEGAAKARGKEPLKATLPRLAPAEDGGEAYERAQAAAERAGALDRELRLVLTASGAQEQRTYDELYTISQRFWETRDEARFDWVAKRGQAPTAFVSRRGGPVLTERYRRHMGRANAARAGKTAAAAEQAERQVAEVAGADAHELVRSGIAFHRGTYAEQRALEAEVVADLRDDPLTAVVNHPGDIRATGVDAYPIAVGAATENRPALVRAFADQLRAVADRPDRLPAVGDPYRTVITDLRSAREPKSSEGTLRPEVRERLWMLWRVRELEKTPEEAYLTARDTLLNFSVDEARTQSRAMSTSLRTIQDLNLALDRQSTKGLQWVIEWSQRELQGPINPLLADARERYLAVLADYPTGTGNAAFDKREAAFRKAKRVAFAGIGRLDDAKRMRRALADTVAATRPEAT